MQVRVRLVAGLSQLAGRPRLELRLDDGATVEDLLRSLGETHPALAPGLPSALPVVAGSHVSRAECSNAAAKSPCSARSRAERNERERDGRRGTDRASH